MLRAALDYDGGRGLRGTVKAHYQWWDLTDAWQADYRGVIVDANVIKDVLRARSAALDVFFTAHNIFDASSYPDFLQQNPGRWLEAGVRCSF